jgi:hypothetical protein
MDEPSACWTSAKQNFKSAAPLDLDARMAYSPPQHSHQCTQDHHLPSFIAFVDLVKAYDTANHDLLLRNLKKYGAPPNFIAAIQPMYTNLVVVLKIKKEVWEIQQSIGVQQGNNIAPVIFLFLMLAAAKTLKVNWYEAGIKVLKVAHTRNDKLETGCICGLTPCIIRRRWQPHITLT